jgi:hypothetical protein
VTAVRFRARTGKHWRAGTLHAVTRHPSGIPGRLVVEITDTRTGNTRTLDTHRHLIDTATPAGGWQPIAAWADTTPSLFDTGEPA